MAYGANITLEDNVTVQFTNNSGLPNGGALSLHGRSTIIFKGTIGSLTGVHISTIFDFMSTLVKSQNHLVGTFMIVNH